MKAAEKSLSSSLLLSGEINIGIANPVGHIK